jgi:hypothetical protein
MIRVVHNQIETIRGNFISSVTSVACSKCGREAKTVMGSDEYARTSAIANACKEGFSQRLIGRILNDFCTNCS